jgi:hypothetical protein
MPSLRNRLTRGRVLVVASAGIAVVAALVLSTQANAITASPTHHTASHSVRVNPDARTGGVVPGGLTGAAARRQTGAAGTHFGQLQRQAAKATPADTLHEAWELIPRDVANGAIATQSVDPSIDVPSTGGDILYTPTLMPGRTSCIELTTIYWSDAAELGAWDWCADQPGFDKVVLLDSSFLSTYTTTVNGRSAYTARIVQTDASSNAWSVDLYNYGTGAFDTFYTSSGTTKLSGNDTGWDMWEIYTNVDPSTGNGYYCPAVSGHSFESSSIQFNIGGNWVATDSSNTDMYPSDRPDGAADFQCPSLTFSGDHSDWVVSG